jgi:hypothetical protein
MSIELSGLLGGLIFLASLAIFLLLTLITFLIKLYVKKYSRETNPIWINSFLKSSLVFLLFDLAYALLFIGNDNKTMTQDEGRKFDENMLFYWLPFHLIGYFVLPFIFAFIEIRKEKINNFLDKLR